MITVRLNGGLGNQMFQYATAKALAMMRKTDLILDVDEFDTDELRDYELDKYNINAKAVSRRTGSEIKMLNPKTLFMKVMKKLKLSNLIKGYYLESSMLFDENINDRVGYDTYLEGYFQSEKYFQIIRGILLNEFEFKNEISDYAQQLKRQIENSTISVSLHIRRGDYVLNGNALNLHGVCSIDYYRVAIGYLGVRFNEIRFFIFSDDIDWVKKSLRIDGAVYVERQEKRMPHEDIYLMSLCNHNIIANSSFSWWGAWLNQDESKVVIAPKRWFLDDTMQSQAMDIVPKSWVKI